MEEEREGVCVCVGGGGGGEWRSGESSPPTNVARVKFPNSCGLSLLWVLVFAPRGFPQTPTLLNSNLKWKVSPISAPR